MKIVRFLGGLGNQMFQYAFYKSLEQTGADVRADINGYQTYSLHNGFELEDLFNIRLKKVGPFISSLYDSSNRKWHLRKLRQIMGLKKAYYEQASPFEFDPSVYENKQGLYWGYWQNVSYVEPVSNLLRKDFIFKRTPKSASTSIFDDIKNSNSVSLHIRRGDYLKDPLLGGICGIAYYQNAVNLLKEHYNDLKFYIFSDDITWSEKNLPIPGAVFVKGNEGTYSFADMHMMSICKHNIIANSSFSWWGAWLNINSNKIVIAPKKWVNITSITTDNITPSSWIKI